MIVVLHGMSPAHVLMLGILVLVAVLLCGAVVFVVPNLKSSLECRLQCLQHVLHVYMLLSVSAVAMFVLIAPLFEGPICGGEVGIEVPAVVGRAAVPACHVMHVPPA